MLTYLFMYSFLINVPYKHGKREAYSKNNHFENMRTINTNQDVKHILYDIHHVKSTCFHTMKNCFTFGGDHTISIGSIFASNDYCIKNNKSLGVIWFDTCLDTDVYIPSKSQKLEDMSVAVLLGHTLQNIAVGRTFLKTSQFAYFGLDETKTQMFVLDKYNLRVFNAISSLLNWAESFDCIHVSFDSKCLRSSDLNITCYNTIACMNVLESISDRIISMDFASGAEMQNEFEKSVINAMYAKVC